MKAIKIIIVLFCGVFALPNIQAQVLEPNDGVYDKVHTETRRVVPYTSLREADVMWSRRIWRTVDLREKMNQFFYYPSEPTNGRENLITIIMNAILVDKTVAAYDAIYDDFKMKLTLSEVAAIGADTLQLSLYRDYPPYDQFDTTVIKQLDVTTIKKFKIKEDWVFDKQKSVMEARIIGICPVRERLDPQTGEFRGYSDMFWVYFPELRRVIANKEIYNRFNNVAQQITYDDVFMKRMFASYIHKEDNVYDRRIEDYMKNGLEALLESEDIKDKIRNFEHDLWEQ
ncbi:MAG: gliding motility protein GldN [Flavobacteriales bacterium]|nr:gliding motility protein GldN [Flavobacteriales bacterium]